MINWDKFKEKLRNFWQRNMERDYKKISAGIGVLLIVIVMGLVDVGVAFFSGDPVMWGNFFIKAILGTGIFLTLMISSFFGRENGKNNNKKT